MRIRPDWKPFLIVVSAPSGTGKTTIVEKVLGKMDNIRRSVSFTTREPRTGEKQGQDYVFLSGEEFLKKKEQGEFLEWEEIFGNHYATSREQISKGLEEGCDLVLSIDVRGAESVKEAFPDSINVFIMPPSEEELKNRLRNRKTDQEQQQKVRLAEARREIRAGRDFDYTVVNDDLDRAVEEFCGIIEKEREKRK
jgi:guanylate kinase